MSTCQVCNKELSFIGKIEDFAFNIECMDSVCLKCVADQFEDFFSPQDLPPEIIKCPICKKESNTHAQ